MTEDPRIRLVRNVCNAGPAVARNRALSVATGTWTAVLDSDDLMHPARLKTLVEAGTCDGADIVADDLLIFDTDHATAPQSLLKGRWASGPFWVDILTYVRLNSMYGGGPILGFLKPLIRSTFLARLPGPYNESLTIGEDYDVIFRLLQCGAKYRIYPELLYFYRRHRYSLSYRLNKDALARMEGADLQILRSPEVRGALARSIRRRARSIAIALAFERLVDALKFRAYSSAFAEIWSHPQTLHLLRFPALRSTRP